MILLSLIPNMGNIIELSYKPVMVKVYKAKLGLIPLVQSGIYKAFRFEYEIFRDMTD